MLLEIQICTFGKEGLVSVSKMKLPEHENIIYTVCLQNPDLEKIEIPKELSRRDIRILQHASKGLSLNRNYGIDNSIGDIILISDDDLNYEYEGLDNVLNTFDNNPSLDFAAFKHIGGDNKKFPEQEFDFSNKEPKGYYLTSFELAIRRKSLTDDIRFSPSLGIGAPFYGAAEENVFLIRLRKTGLNGRFFPLVIVEHGDVTTGNRSPSKAFLRAQGAYFWIRFGWIGGFARVVLDVYRRKAPSITNLKHMSNGFFRAHKFFKRDGSDILD